MTMGEKDGFYP